MNFHKKTRALFLSFLLAAQVGCAVKQRPLNESLLTLPRDELGAVLRVQDNKASAVRAFSDKIKVESNLVSLYGLAAIKGREFPFYAEIGVERGGRGIERVPGLDRLVIAVSEDTVIGEMRHVVDYQTLGSLFVRRTFEAPVLPKSKDKIFYLQFAPDTKYYELFIADSKNKSRIMRCTDDPKIPAAQRCADFPESEDPVAARKVFDGYSAGLLQGIFDKVKDEIAGRVGEDKKTLVVTPLSDAVLKEISKKRKAEFSSGALIIK